MTNAINREQKKEWAQLLYVHQRLSQREVAEKVGVSTNTMCKWVDRYKWDELRKSMLMTREQQLRRLYDQLDWLTEQIAAREKKVAEAKEAGTITRLTAAIRSLETETSLAGIVDAGQRFISFIRAQDLDKAREVTALYDTFIRDYLK